MRSGAQAARLAKLARCQRCNGRGRYRASGGRVVDCGPCQGTGRANPYLDSRFDHLTDPTGERDS